MNLALMRRRAYWQTVSRIKRSNLLAYWPLWESAGTVMRDTSGNGRNGTYQATGITYGQSGIGDAWTSAALSVEGSNDNVTFKPIKDVYGNQIGASSVSTTSIIQFDAPYPGLGVPYVRFVSGTSASAVAQGGTRTITYALKVM